MAVLVQIKYMLVKICKKGGNRNREWSGPIIGASRPEQLTDPVAAVAMPLDAELVSRLDELTYEYRFGDNGR